MISTVEKPELRVVYDPTFQEEGISYRVSVNAESATQLLLESGMSETQLKATTLRVVRRPGEEYDNYSQSNYNRESRSLVVYADNNWSRGGKGRREVNRYFLWAAGLALQHDKLRDSYFHRQMVSLATTSTVFMSGIGGLLIGGATEAHPAVMIGSAGLLLSTLIAPGLSEFISYYTDPVQRQARRFAKERASEPKWQNIVTIQHKNRLVRAINGLVDGFLSIEKPISR